MPRLKHFYGQHHLHYLTANTYREARILDCDRGLAQTVAVYRLRSPEGTVQRGSLSAGHSSGSPRGAGKSRLAESQSPRTGLFRAAVEPSSPFCWILSFSKPQGYALRQPRYHSANCLGWLENKNAPPMPSIRLIIISPK